MPDAGNEMTEAAVTQELRVHGVGGSHGSRMLGFESDTDVVVVGEGVGGTAVLARRDDPTVESYDWGDLTSASGLRALWIFLLPFTLLNVAGWMHPPESRTSQGRVNAIRAMVHLLSVLLTATYVLSLGVIMVDVVGWQWVRRLASPNDEEAYLKELPSTIGKQQAGVVVALIVLGLVALALVWLAGRSQMRFEETKLSPQQATGLDDKQPWDEDERLDCRSFFFHPGNARDRLRLHKLVLAVSYLSVAAWSLSRAFGAGLKPQDRLEVGRLLGFCGVAAALLILVLWALSFDNGRRQGERWVRGAPAIAAVLAFGLVHAVSSGAILLLLKRLNDWPERPKALLRLLPVPEVNLVDVWGAVLLILVAAAVTLYVLAALSKKADGVPDRNSPPGWPLDGADESHCAAIAKSRFTARLARRSGALAASVALLLVTAYVGAVGYRVFFRMRDHDGVFLAAPKDLDDPLYRVGAYALPLLALIVVQLIRKGISGARTIASTLWDVLTFWPRRFSPLAVRPYSERAVPELQGRVLHQVVEHGRPLIVSAHSQGSVLAFAALAPLTPEQLGRVTLVTYGSPMGTIYATFFPAYFGAKEVDALATKLSPPGTVAVRWRNFHRRTDPIGGPVFGTSEVVAAGADRELPDPYPGPATEDGPPPSTDAPLERDRPAWSQLAVHSYYLQEPELKAWVRTVRTALARGGPPDEGR